MTALLMLLIFSSAAFIFQAAAPAAGTGDLIVQAGAAGMFTKVLVDAVKTTPVQTLGWVLVLLAFAFGQASAFLLAMSTGDGLAWTQKALSTCVLVGILAAGSAIAATELHKKAEELKAGF